ncbi:hypothetical protein, partial [Thermogemmatispora sp.]|uniref:hypothetical protein n=1 Tax=Thermogemmatispora sp. TaxID=1968838 RepID=UPI00260FF973
VYKSLVQGVVSIPEHVRAIDRRVEQGSDRVAEAVIEFRARTMMVKEIAKAFFLPGLVRREVARTDAPRAAASGERSWKAVPLPTSHSAVDGLSTASELEGSGQRGGIDQLPAREETPASQAMQSMRHVAPH